MTSHSKSLLILGMHRSGTSCMTGALADAGFKLGKIRQKSRGNPLGNQEIPRVWQLNNRLFEFNDAHWTQPELITRWLPEHEQQRDQILREFDRSGGWLIKDPRMMFALEFWRAGIDPKPMLAGSFRHPAAVINSFTTRDNRDPEESLNLWKRHNYRLRDICREEDIAIVNFDSASEIYEKKMMMVMGKLGMTKPDRLGFFDPKYRKELSDKSFPDRESMLLYRSLDRLEKWQFRWGGLVHKARKRLGI